MVVLRLSVSTACSSIVNLDAPNPYPPILIICGPTACGKSQLALRLARAFANRLEIVSADSRQIFKHLNVGTAKPSNEELQIAPHHCINLIEPGERYSAAQFVRDATSAIHDIISRRKIPVVVGGTGLYLKALTEGLVEIEDSVREVRETLETEFDSLGADAMWERLRQIDPLEAAKVHPNNRPRITRALEIYLLTGKTKSDQMFSSRNSGHQFSFKYLSLIPEREQLYKTINSRVETMFEQGWLAEVQALVEQGLGTAVAKSNVIGYTELLEVVARRLTLEDVKGGIMQETRRFAKRQMTWFRHQVEATPFSDMELAYERAAQEIEATIQNVDKT